MAGNRILSGMQPSGQLHLGNYHGALKNWVSMQDSFDCFFFIADLHSLTTLYEDPQLLKKYSFEVAVDWLSSGLDPEKCTHKNKSTKAIHITESGSHRNRNQSFDNA